MVVAAVGGLLAVAALGLAAYRLHPWPVALPQGVAAPPAAERTSGAPPEQRPETPAPQATRGAGSPRPMPVVGNPAPDLVLADLAGRSVRLSTQWRGRPALLNFWATWCVPCRQEMPEIRRFHREFGNRVAVIGIDLAEPREVVEAYVREGDYRWTFLLDSAGRAAEAYLVVALPTTFFIGPDGIIRAKHLGPMRYEQMVRYGEMAGMKRDSSGG